jgi:hypothetical protein
MHLCIKPTLDIDDQLLEAARRRAAVFIGRAVVSLENDWSTVMC